MLYAVKIFDIKDSGPLRDKYRTAHLDYIEKSEDKTIFAGPILSEDLKTELGSHLIINLPNLLAVERHIADEPYVFGGVQHSPEIHRWSASVPFTWRNCPRKKGNVQYLIHAIDKPNSSRLRDQLRAEHEAYQANVKDLYITRGPLLSERGSTQVGSLMIIDVPDLIAARKFWENEPFTKGNLFANVEFYG